MAASLGIASIGALASLAIYRNYFIAFASLVLGYSFYLSLKKKYRSGQLSFKTFRFGKDDALLLATAILVVLAILFPILSGVTPGPARATYEAHGSILVTDLSGKKVTLNHEEIKGLMPAMTMEFPVKSIEVLSGLRAGDKVRFSLSSQGGNFVVEKIVKEEKEGLR